MSAKTSTYSSAVESAELYRRSGFVPVCVPAGEKGPCTPGWPDEALRGEQTFQEGDNIGLLTGVNGLVDIDLDCPEALAVADYFLPSTAAQFGKASTPTAHRMYRVREEIVND